jgi:hypothetical protein
MEQDEEIDEIALNILLLDGMDVPTAVAGSLKEEEPEPAANELKSPTLVALVAAIIVATLLIWWFI